MASHEQTTSVAEEQHHAEYSKFSQDATKEEAYETLILSAKALFVDNGTKLPAISNLSNAASLIWHLFQQITPSVNWAGFYLRDPAQNQGTDDTQQQLILGPFQGKVACQLIKFGKGVCGTAAATAQTQLVPDVNAFPGHIACDGDTNSEIVVPIVREGAVIGVIDIDSTKLNSFDKVDKKYLEELAQALVEYTNWGNY